MIEHYNAFISYKHAPQDIKVAEAIQRGLEHFHIPAALRKKTGKKKIERIFRDKDELPITSDLSDDISHALEHADYLIVICSTSTRESVWVPREIEYFLKNHTRRQILTVLVDGEPQDVIPDILLHEDREVTNEHGETQTITVALEPLSCDYRMPIKRANKEELPRLAAALIGCSYDELMNRHRQYKMQRLTAVFTGILLITLAFGGYMLYSRNQIKANYQESLRNQSRYLAKESEQLLQNEQRIPALQLALHALPEKDERPVTAEAVRALTDATLSYVSLSGTNIHAAWNYQMPNQIKDYIISPEGTTIAVLDIGNIIYVWKTDTHEAVFTLNNSSDTIYGITYLSEDTLMVWTADHVYAYNILTSSIVWEQEMTDTLARDESVFLTADGNIVLRQLSNSMIQLSGTDGSVQKQIRLPEKQDENLISIYNWAVSPDEQSIVFCGYTGFQQYIMGVYDIGAGTTVFTDITSDSIRDLYWADNDHLMISYSVNSSISSISSNNRSFLSTDHTWIRCYVPADLTLLWEYDFTSNEVMYGSGFLSLPNQNRIAYYCGNIADIYELETGERLYHHNVNDSIIDLSDRDGDGWPLYLTKDGGMAVPQPSSGEECVTLVKQFTDDLDRAIVNQGVYVHTSMSREIIFYDLYVSDEDWTEYDDSIVLSPVNTHYLDDRILALLTAEEAGVTLTLFDPNDQTLLRQLIVEDADGDSITTYGYSILGRYENTLCLIHEDLSNATLLNVDLTDGTITEHLLPNAYMTATQYIHLQDGKILYTGKPDYGIYTLSIYDLMTDKASDYPLPEEYASPLIQPVYIPQQNCVYYADQRGDMLIYPETGMIQNIELPENWNGTCCMAVNPDDPEELAISDLTTILIVHTNGTDRIEISCAGLEPLGVCFCDTDSNHQSDSLLVPYNSGELYRYDLKDGTFTGKSEISTYINGTYSSEFHIDEDNHLLYIQMDSLLDIIDMDSFVEIAYIDHCLGHHEATDHYVTTSYTTGSENRVGYFRHYTLEELKQKGWDILQGSDLTEEQKAGYGID